MLLIIGLALLVVGLFVMMRRGKALQVKFDDKNCMVVKPKQASGLKGEELNKAAIKFYVECERASRAEAKKFGLNTVDGIRAEDAAQRYHLYAQLVVTDGVEYVYNYKWNTAA